jgi:hypothetical protein
MAIKLSAAYSKKAGLPGYSSHSFSVSIETELQNLDNVREESARLYDSLQQAVDQQIQKTGFVPPDGYGMEGDKNGLWNCSEKQRELIKKIGRENNLDQSVLIVSLVKCSARQSRRSTSSKRAGLSMSFWIGTVKELNMAAVMRVAAIQRRKEQPYDCACSSP